MTDYSPDGVTRSECKAEDAYTELRERAEKLVEAEWASLYRDCSGCDTAAKLGTEVSECAGFDSPRLCEQSARYDGAIDDAMERLK
jgi:hypothetical protein